MPCCHNSIKSSHFLGPVRSPKCALPMWGMIHLCFVRLRKLLTWKAASGKVFRVFFCSVLITWPTCDAVSLIVPNDTTRVAGIQSKRDGANHSNQSIGCGLAGGKVWNVKTIAINNTVGILLHDSCTAFYVGNTKLCHYDGLRSINPFFTVNFSFFVKLFVCWWPVTWYP